MTDKLIRREYLVTLYQNFLDKLKLNITGEVSDLQTNADRIVPAINELLLLIYNGLNTKELTAVQFNTMRHAYATPDDKIHFRTCRIIDEYNDNGTIYNKNTFAYAYNVIPVGGHYEYEWHLIDNTNGRFGNADLLETIEKQTSIGAINELLNYILSLVGVTDVTYADWEANEKDQLTNDDLLVDRKIYRLSSDYKDPTTNQVWHAGTIIYSNGYTTGPLGKVYKWEFLDNADGLIGDLTELDARVKGDTIVDTINNIVAEFAVDVEEDTTTDLNAINLHKRYNVHQGLEADGTKTLIGTIDIPKVQVEANAEKIQLAVDENNVVSADVVTESLEKTDLVVTVQHPIDFVGYDEALAKQLTTTAQTLREAINELDEKQGDDALTTKAQDISAAINELQREMDVLIQKVTDQALIDDPAIAAIYEFWRYKDDDTVQTKIGEIEIPATVNDMSVELRVPTSAELATDPTLIADYKYLIYKYINQGEPVIKYVPMPEINFVGYDDTLGVNPKAYYKLCDSTYPNALAVVRENLDGSTTAVTLAQVQNVNNAAGKTDVISLGDYVVYMPVRAAEEQLSTTASTVREAINEHDAEIGDLATLLTHHKDDLVGAINETYQRQPVYRTCTYKEFVDQWSHPHYTDPDPSLVAPEFNIITTDEFVHNGSMQYAGTVIYGFDLVADTDGSYTFDWQVLESDNGQFGDIGALNTQFTDTLVEAINSVLVERKIEVTSNTDDANVLKTYVITQGKGTDSEVEYKIDIPLDLVVTSGSSIIATAQDAIDYASQNIVEGRSYLKLIIANQTEPVFIDAKDMVNDYETELNATHIQLTIDATDDPATGKADKVIKAEIVNKSINKDKLHDDVVEILDFVDKPTELDTTEKASVTKAINEVLDKEPIAIEDVAANQLATGIQKAYKVTQGTTTPTEIGTIEIPYANYDGVETDTIAVTVDSTDGNRKISADVVDGSIGKTQLDTEVNDILDQVEVNRLNILERVRYVSEVSFAMFNSSHKDLAEKDDLFIISNDFTFDGNQYKAGSWMICTDVSAMGARTWKVLNNAGASTKVSAISDDAFIREIPSADGTSTITDVIGAYINDPQGTMYFIATTPSGNSFFPHNGVYIKTSDAGGTSVMQIFDLASTTADGATGKLYTGSTGANIKIDVNNVPATGIIDATVVPNSLGNLQFNLVTNDTLDLVGYGTNLTTNNKTLTRAVNEHDAEIGDLSTLNVEQMSPAFYGGSLVNVINAMANGNMKYQGPLQLLPTTTTFSTMGPVCKGYVYNVSGASNVTVNGLTLSNGDWVIATTDTVLGNEPTFKKIGSMSTGGPAGTSVTLTILN